MKYSSIIIGGCSARLVVANLLSYSFPDFDEESILQTRRPDNDLYLLSRSYPFQRRGLYVINSNGGHVQRNGGPSPQIPPEKMITPQRQSHSLQQMHVQKFGPPAGPPPPPPGGNGRKRTQNGDGLEAKASVVARGPASLRVASPSRSLDSYVRTGKMGSLGIQHPHTVAAGGIVGDIPPNGSGPQQRANHPLEAQAEAKSVMGQVYAPPGGAGKISIQTSEGLEDFHVPGDTSARRTRTAGGPGKAKVKASVSYGGGIKVAGAPIEAQLDSVE